MSQSSHQSLEDNTECFGSHLRPHTWHTQSTLTLHFPVWPCSPTSEHSCMDLSMSNTNEYWQFIGTVDISQTPLSSNLPRLACPSAEAALCPRGPPPCPPTLRTSAGDSACAESPSFSHCRTQVLLAPLPKCSQNYHRCSSSSLSAPTVAFVPLPINNVQAAGDLQESQSSHPMAAEGRGGISPGSPCGCPLSLLA